MDFTRNDENWIERLAERPGIFPHTLDLVSDSLLLVELPEAEIAAASFVDQRVLRPTSEAAHTFGWGEHLASRNEHVAAVLKRFSRSRRPTRQAIC